MPQRIEEQGELTELLECSLDLADGLDLPFVGAKIAEVPDHLRPASGPVGEGL